VDLVWDQPGTGTTALVVAGPGLADLLDADPLATRAEQAGRIAVVPAGALDTSEAVVPTAGVWSTDGDGLRFTPRFPFQAGTTYAVVRREDAAGRAALGWAEVARLVRPATTTLPTASVVAIHPRTSEVPENLLRLSVTFSASMDEGSAAGHVHLEDADGRDIPHALLAMPPELWDRPRRRLTLLLEPGRIKRGLVPNTALGAPLSHTSEITLVVDAEMRDAVGSDLVTGARQTYRVTPAVRERVDPYRWQVAWPTAGSHEVLTVEFVRPLDHALALACLRVTNADGVPLPGHATLDPGEVRWSFTASDPWPVGPWLLRVDAALEDLAGNSVRRVFDRDLRLAQDDPLLVNEVVLGSDDDGSPVNADWRPVRRTSP